MQNDYLFTWSFIVILLLIVLNHVSYGQTAQNDTLYLFDGEIIATSIFDGWETSDRIRHRISNRHPVESVARSSVFYIYAAGKYHQISPYDRHEQLSLNMQAFQNEARTGMMLLGAGAGVVLLGNLLNEQQQKRVRESLDPNDITDTPKYLNYGGYALMVVGSLVTVSSFRFLNRGSVDITPVGVRVNLSSNN